SWTHGGRRLAKVVEPAVYGYMSAAMSTRRRRASSSIRSASPILGQLALRHALRWETWTGTPPCSPISIASAIARSRVGPSPRRRGGRREAAHPRDLGGDALANLGLGGGHGQQREVGVRVHVDETRGDERASGVHDLAGLAGEAGRDGDHALALDGDVGADGR